MKLPVLSDPFEGQSAKPQAAAAVTPLECDVLVVGGGINGAGIARDLAGRGLRVVLCEQDDLAAHTSSASTKLIHGGLRYLEHGEFTLVRKALAERERLLRSAPHILWPLRFVMPHDPTSVAARPTWLIRLGLFLYDHLARREWLAASRHIDLRQHPAGAPLWPRFRDGFEYADGWADDARLVVLNALDAAERGATVLTRWRCVDANRSTERWQLRLASTTDAQALAVSARALVNATGPWAAQFLGEQVHAPVARPLRLVKGSHIVVRRLFDHDCAYLLPLPDRRIVFAIPYEGDFTLIGTTEVEQHAALEAHGRQSVEPAEVAYLCEQVSRYFARPVRPADVIWSYAGVRPLLDDGASDAAAVTRDYALELDVAGAPLLSVWGGKLTTYRKLAEEAVDQLAVPLRIGRGAWTAQAVLPGGDFSDFIGTPQQPDVDFARFAAELVRRHPELPKALVYRWARAYGSRAERVIGADGLGTEVAPGLFEAELHYMHEVEFACSADDVLWRRSKLGLHLDAEQRTAVAMWCADHWGEPGFGVMGADRPIA